MLGHSSHSSSAECVVWPYPDDELGRLIRSSLDRSFGDSGPSDECWARILSRIDTRARSNQGRNRRSLLPSIAPLVQAVVIGGLLLSFAVGLAHQPVLPRQETDTGLAHITRRPAQLAEDNLNLFALRQFQQASVLAEARNIPQHLEMP
jgi:hypothetical protein